MSARGTRDPRIAKEAERTKATTKMIKSEERQGEGKWAQHERATGKTGACISGVKESVKVDGMEEPTLDILG